MSFLRRLLLLAPFALAACGDGTPEAPALTYWKDVAPITEARCARCHQPGGIAPFRLDSYDDVKQRALLVASATRSGIMPPYLLTHDGSCGQVDDEEALTPAERDTIWTWTHGEMAEGTRTAVPVAAPAVLQTDSAWQTPTITPVAQGGALAEVDEYRCFPVDPGMT